MLELNQDLTKEQLLACRSHYSTFGKGGNVMTYLHAALVLGQVAPVADPAPLLHMALVPKSFIHLAEAWDARNLISYPTRPILNEHLIQDADVAMAPGAFQVWIMKPDTHSQGLSLLRAAAGFSGTWRPAQ